MTDDAKIWVAFISGGLALFGTIYVAVLNYFSHKEQDKLKAATEKELATFKSNTDRSMAQFQAETNQELARLNSNLEAERDERLAKKEAEKVVSKFRDPLLHAAYDLQSRIFNVLKQEFLTVYLANGSDSEKDYSVENTVFLVAQFLGWTELIRQEIQFLDLGNDDETRELRRLQDGMYTQFQTDRFGKGFRLFAGEQRAVGELMIDRTGTLPRCIGFAAFLKNRDPKLDHWLDPLREDIKKMAGHVAPFTSRLVGIQHSLIDLLEFLDPRHVYFPKSHRTKI